MKGFVQDIEGLAVKNDEFRRVLYTAKHCQLVVMALKPKEEIGAEVHKLDQFFRVEEGAGEAVLDGLLRKVALPEQLSSKIHGQQRHDDGDDSQQWQRGGYGAHVESFRFQWMYTGYTAARPEIGRIASPTQNAITQSAADP